ncbi:TCP-1/Cpn60 chaperonin family protein, partial [Ostertagia ostertagi]
PHIREVCISLVPFSRPLLSRQQDAKSFRQNFDFQVVSQHSWLLAPMAVNAVKRIIDPTRDTSVNLKMIKIIKKMGDTVEESEMIDGALIDQKTMGRGGPTRVEKAKIGLIQFQLSPPKTDMENQVIISDYTQMDRALKEERQYLLDLCKQIKKAGCNVLLIQKSILRFDLFQCHIHSRRMLVSLPFILLPNCVHSMPMEILITVSTFGRVTSPIFENVLQPLMVTMSAIQLASECVRSILKIDDIVTNLYEVADTPFGGVLKALADDADPSESLLQVLPPTDSLLKECKKALSVNESAPKWIRDAVERISSLLKSNLKAKKEEKERRKKAVLSVPETNLIFMNRPQVDEEMECMAR